MNRIASWLVNKVFRPLEGEASLSNPGLVTPGLQYKFDETSPPQNIPIQLFTPFLSSPAAPTLAGVLRLGATPALLSGQTPVSMEFPTHWSPSCNTHESETTGLDEAWDQSELL